MAVSHTIGWTWERGTEQIAGTYTASADGELTLDSSLDDATDATLTGALDVSEVESVFIISTQDATVHINGVNEIQTITFTGTVSGGTYTLTYSGQTTSNIAYDATAATVEAALEALSNIAVNDVSVTGGPGGTGGVFTVTFRKTLAATNVSQLTSATGSLTGGGSISHATSTAGVAAGQTIELVANVPFKWLTDPGYYSNPLTVDWTHLLVSNDSGAPAAFSCRVLYNP